MVSQANLSRHELEARLLDRAWKDEAFRRALLEDPKGALERELGMPVAEGVNLTVLEETLTNRYLILPPAPTGTAGELSDADLEAVAGGNGPPSVLPTFDLFVDPITGHTLGLPVC